MRAVLGRVANIKSFPSMGIARLEVEVPIESYVDAVGLLFGQDTLITVADPGLKEKLGRYGVHDTNEDAPKAHEHPSDECGDQTHHGGLTKLAGILCKNPEFWRFLSVYDSKYWSLSNNEVRGCQNETDAAMYVRDVCGIDSRRELDTNQEAATSFHKLRRAWVDWRVGQ